MRIFNFLFFSKIANKKWILKNKIFFAVSKIEKCQPISNTHVFQSARHAVLDNLHPPPPPSPRFTPPASFGPSHRWIAPPRKKPGYGPVIISFSFRLFQGAFHSTQNSGNSGWFIKWNGPFRFGPTGIFGTSFEGGPQWPVWSFRSVEPKCPFPFAKIVVPSTALLYPAYRNN